MPIKTTMQPQPFQNRLRITVCGIRQKHLFARQFPKQRRQSPFRFDKCGQIIEPMRCFQKIPRPAIQHPAYTQQGGTEAFPVFDTQGIAPCTSDSIESPSAFVACPFRYAFIFALILGKMACDALCRVLSRSNNQIMPRPLQSVSHIKKPMHARAFRENTGNQAGFLVGAFPYRLLIQYC